MNKDIILSEAKKLYIYLKFEKMVQDGTYYKKENHDFLSSSIDFIQKYKVEEALKSIEDIIDSINN